MNELLKFFSVNRKKEVQIKMLAFQSLCHALKFCNKSDVSMLKHTRSIEWHWRNCQKKSWTGEFSIFAYFELALGFESWCFTSCGTEFWRHKHIGPVNTRLFQSHSLWWTGSLLRSLMVPNNCVESHCFNFGKAISCCTFEVDKKSK